MKIETPMGSGGGGIIYLDPSERIDIVDGYGRIVIVVERACYPEIYTFIARKPGDDPAGLRLVVQMPSGENRHDRGS